MATVASLRGELAHLITDYATARAGEIQREEIPLLQKILESEGENQFVCLLTRARLMAKEAELALFVAQAEGQLADADLKNAFAALDTNRGRETTCPRNAEPTTSTGVFSPRYVRLPAFSQGMISKSEFFKGASDVLFATQLERIKKWKGVLNDTMSAIDGN